MQGRHRLVHVGVEHGVHELGAGHVDLLQRAEREARANAVERLQQTVGDRLDPAEPEVVAVQLGNAQAAAERTDRGRADPVDARSRDERPGPEQGLGFVEDVAARVPRLVGVRLQDLDSAAGLHALFSLLGLLGELSFYFGIAPSRDCLVGTSPGTSAVMLNSISPEALVRFGVPAPGQ